MSVINYLRDAAVQALEQGKWVDARRLFTMLEDELGSPPSPPTPEPVMPVNSAQQPTQKGKYRGEVEWAVIIRNHFIPDMKKAGRFELCMEDVYDWVLHQSGLVLSERDLEKIRHDSDERWKDRAAAGVRRLRLEGVLVDGSNKRKFRIPGATKPHQLPLGAEIP